MRASPDKAMAFLETLTKPAVIQSARSAISVTTHDEMRRAKLINALSSSDPMK